MKKNLLKKTIPNLFGSLPGPLTTILFIVIIALLIFAYATAHGLTLKWQGMKETYPTPAHTASAPKKKETAAPTPTLSLSPTQQYNEQTNATNENIVIAHQPTSIPSSTQTQINHLLPTQIQTTDILPTSVSLESVPQVSIPPILPLPKVIEKITEIKIELPKL